jgi:hypothetical protein
MEHAEMYLINVGFCTMYILNKWIQLQYGNKHYSNLWAFHVNQHGCMLGDMSLGQSTLKCNTFKHMWKFIIAYINIAKVVWRQDTLNHISHFTRNHLKFIIKVFSTLVYLMENLNLKDKLLKYYFH